MIIVSQCHNLSNYILYGIYDTTLMETHHIFKYTLDLTIIVFFFIKWLVITHTLQDWHSGCELTLKNIGKYISLTHHYLLL